MREDRISEYSIKVEDKVVIGWFEEAKEWFLPKLVKVERNGDTVTIDEHDRNLFLNQFWVESGLSRRQIQNILDVKPYLKDYYDDVSDIQENKLLMKGLYKELDSSLTKFTLANKHSWREKSDIKQNTNHNLKNVNLKDLFGFNED